MKHTYPNLFSPFMLGKLELKNRIVMAPMTRSRAMGNIPNEIMAKYYSDRADAGLIITEGTSPSPNGLGYARIPGIFSAGQQTGWRAVTEAVHAKNGNIFLQIMHTGRVSHSLNMPHGAKVVAPSAIAAVGQMWTDQKGMQVQPLPEEITFSEIPLTIEEYVLGSKAAIEAGFDGVELHAANGYLPMQFLNPGSNQHKDTYGGNGEHRNRFVLELVAAIAAAIGKDKTGIRLSPSNPFNDMSIYEGADEQYILLAEGLQKLGLAYIHLVGFLGYNISDWLLNSMKEVYKGAFILNGGYTAEKAESAILSGKGDLISFGTPFIANPDFVRRIATGAELTKPDPSSFYTPGEKGYTDYQTISETGLNTSPKAKSLI
jgi:N-ethylmaleimide reductase